MNYYADILWKERKATGLKLQVHTMAINADEKIDELTQYCESKYPDMEVIEIDFFKTDNNGKPLTKRRFK